MMPLIQVGVIIQHINNFFSTTPININFEKYFIVIPFKYWHLGQSLWLTN